MGEERVERVGERRELGFAILLTYVSAVIGYRLDIVVGCFWFSRAEKRRQQERMKWQKGKEFDCIDRSALVLWYSDIYCGALLR